MPCRGAKMRFPGAPHGRPLQFFGTTRCKSHLRSVFHDNNRYIIAPTAEVAVDDPCDQAGMMRPQPWVGVKVPVRPEAIRVHQEHGLWRKRILKLLDPRCRVSGGPILRNHTMTLGVRAEND